MYKWWLSLLILVLVGAGWYIYNQSLSAQIKTDLINKAVDLAKNQTIVFDGNQMDPNNPQNPLEEVVSLAIKGINLFQGDQGVELWRLKASFANVSKDGAEITVQNPQVRYQLDTGELKNTPNELLVDAKQGKLTENQRFLTLWGDVIVTHGQDILQGQTLDYDAKTRIMTFPKGATLTSPEASGQAQNFSWDLANNIMQATGNVEIIIKPKPETEPETEANPQAKINPKVEANPRPGVSNTQPLVVPRVAQEIATNPKETVSKAATKSTVKPTTKATSKSTPKKTTKAISKPTPKKTTKATSKPTPKKTTKAISKSTAKPAAKTATKATPKADPKAATKASPLPKPSPTTKSLK